MARSFDFAVVKIVPDPLRDEALNAAVVVLLPDGLEVHVAPNPERLRAIAPAFTSEVLDHLASALRNVDQKSASTTDRLGILRRLPGVLISEPGTLQSENDAELRSHISGLVNRLLSPVRLPLQKPTVKTTALIRELAKVFRREKLLGHDEDALKQHKIIRNHPISPDGSIKADFVAKNSAYHVTETVDLRTPGELTMVRVKDIAVAAVTLDEAKRKLGRRTQRYFVYAATSAEERRARGFLDVAEHHAEHVFNYSSHDDRSHYLDFMLSALRGDLASKARQDDGRVSRPPRRRVSRKRR
jgi:hypothetical protein